MTEIKCPLDCPNDLMKPIDGICLGCNVLMFNVHFKCGHSDIHEAFETYDSEPNNLRYQCPECGVEWSISGLRIARKKKLEKERSQINSHYSGCVL